MSETAENDGAIAAAARVKREQAVIECLEAIRSELHSLPSRIVWLYVAVMIWVWIIAGIMLGLLLWR